MGFLVVFGNLFGMARNNFLDFFGGIHFISIMYPIFIFSRKRIYIEIMRMLQA